MCADRVGFLGARSAADHDDRQNLLARERPRLRALPPRRYARLRCQLPRRSVLPRLVKHVRSRRPRTHGLPASRHVAALVPNVASRKPVCASDAELVLAALDLTPAERQVAVTLAVGRSPRDIAAATDSQGTHKPALALAENMQSSTTALVPVELARPNVFARRPCTDSGVQTGDGCVRPRDRTVFSLITRGIVLRHALRPRASSRAGSPARLAYPALSRPDRRQAPQERT